MNDLNVNCGARLDFLIFEESLKLPPKHIWKQRRNEKETNIFTRIRNKHRYKKGSIKTLKSWCLKHVTVNSVMSNSGLSNCSPDAGLLWLTGQSDELGVVGVTLGLSRPTTTYQLTNHYGKMGNSNKINLLTFDTIILSFNVYFSNLNIPTVIFEVYSL